MREYLKDNSVTIFNGDAQQMAELPDNSVQCVVTSPPYWGLRKYAGLPDGQYGLEPTPELYIEHTLVFLREIRRVLRKDGVVFWNIGDSYAGSWGNSGSRAGGQRPHNVGRFDRPGYDNHTERPPQSYTKSKRIPRESGRWGGGNNPASGVLKPKDLCLIPFRVAIAAQEDGWWVRSVIIWSKPNPMPESVTDRPTESHEYILMLTKSAKYYWDQEAVREPNLPQSIERAKHAWKQHKTNDMVAIHNVDTERMGERFVPEAGRNIRSVWEFPTQPYPAAHFAVFPEKLPEICIKAATPEVGCCSKCGAPWERIVERIDKGWDGSKYGENVVTASGGAKSGGTAKSTLGSSHGQLVGSQNTLGWQPTCKCNADKVPSLVLDPFAGSGTTLWVSKKLGRRAVGYELSDEYCKLALERNRQMVLWANEAPTLREK